MRLSPSERRLLILLVVACGVLLLFTSWRPSPSPDPLRQPTDLYPHVNASDTFQVVAGWPIQRGGGRRNTGVPGRTSTSGCSSAARRCGCIAGGSFCGFGPGHIARASGSTGPSERIWVAGCGRHCVEKFARMARLLTLGTPGGPGGDDSTTADRHNVTPDGDVRCRQTSALASFTSRGCTFARGAAAAMAR